MTPPLFINNKLEPDFKLKANFFNRLFADKCTPIQNNSVIPNFIECDSMNRLTSTSFNDESILKIIRALDVNKAHGHDDISIRMIKMCNKSITPTILLIFKNCISSGIFPNIWKKFIRKVISKLLKITDQFHLYQSLVKYLKGLFLIHCLNFFMKTIYLMRINHNSDHLIHVNISSYQLYMIYMHLLTVTHLVMPMVYLGHIKGF